MRHTAPAVLTALLLPLAGGVLAGPAEAAGFTTPTREEAPALGRESPGAGQETAAPERGPIRVHPEAREAIDRLKSPFCPGLMLEVCPSPQAGEMRDSLNALAHRGVGSDSLVAMVLAAYGEEWRAVPEARGRGLVAWLVPPVVLLLGILGLIVGLRRFTASSGGGVPERPGISEEERRRLDEALRELETEEEPLF